jgi:hypothetical protein
MTKTTSRFVSSYQEELQSLQRRGLEHSLEHRGTRTRLQLIQRSPLYVKRPKKKRMAVLMEEKRQLEVKL